MVGRKQAYGRKELEFPARERWIYELVLNNMTYDQISELALKPPVLDYRGWYTSAGGLGYSLTRPQISRHVTRIKEEHIQDWKGDLDAERSLELDRLTLQAQRVNDLVQRWEQDEGGVVTKRDADQRLRAELTLLRISERRARLIGLDAPTQATAEVTITHVDGTSIELAQMMEKLRKENEIA